MRGWLAFYILVTVVVAFISFLIGTMYSLRLTPPPHVSIEKKSLMNQPNPNKDPEPPPFVLLEVTATAYSPYAGTIKPHRQMASGRYATKRTLGELRYIAVSRDLKKDFSLNWGDEIFLSFRVEDLMAKGKEKQIDLFMKEGRAKDFGKQRRKVIILKER